MEKKIKGERLWPVLLVVDSLFIIVFGGAFAALVYQHWAMPSPRLDLPPRPATSLSRPVALPPGVQPAAHGAPPPPSAAIPSNPHPTAPSRTAPSEEEGGGPVQTPAPDASGRSSKSTSVEFRYKSSRAQSVALAGTFLRKNAQLPLRRGPNGIWTRTIHLLPDINHSYRYYFIVDGQKMRDPANPRFKGSYSLLMVKPLN